MDICPKCGLPEQACVCEEIAKSEQKIRIELVKRKYGKLITVVDGIGEGVDIKALAKDLKNELACGGTVKDNTVELQGNHLKKITAVLERKGFTELSIIDKTK